MAGINTTKRILSVSLLTALFLVIGVYSYSKAENILSGAEISLSNITDGMTVTEPLLSVEGNAKNSSTLSMNDRPILVDQNYNFKESLLMLPGYNTITFRGTDRFGKKTEKTFQVVYIQKINSQNALSISTINNL